MKINKLIFMIFMFGVLISSLFCKENLKLTEFGYIGQHWGNEIITLHINCKNKIADYNYKIEEKELKEYKIDTGIINFKLIIEFLEFINKKDILNLKSASIFDPDTKNNDFISLYGKKLPDIDAFIYEFYFIVDKKKYRFKIDDIKNISDKRYLILLKAINKIVKKPTFLTIFGFRH